MPSTFSVAIGGLAADEAQEKQLLEDLKKLVGKYSKMIHQAAWEGQSTGRHFLKEEQ
jgi:hypothetical protein